MRVSGHKTVLTYRIPKRFLHVLFCYQLLFCPSFKAILHCFSSRLKTRIIQYHPCIFWIFAFTFLLYIVTPVEFSFDLFFPLKSSTMHYFLFDPIFHLFFTLRKLSCLVRPFGFFLLKFEGLNGNSFDHGVVHGS